MEDFTSKFARGEVRIDSFPILHVRGTHYVVGFTIGRTFRAMISDLLDSWDYVNVLIAQYETSDGRSLYESCLRHCKDKFPKYVAEIEGMADGSRVPFYKLFLLNIDTIMTAKCPNASAVHTGTGCTTIICNKEQLIIGHSEDADKEILNNVYIVAADILDDDGNMLEEFTSFSYAGHLMGYTMGFNKKGMVHTINTIFPTVNTSGSPRGFIARALLNASTLEETKHILRDSGSGTSDGFSLNVYYANEPEGQRFYNIEVGPPISDSGRESQLDILPIPSGSSNIHSNKYCRLTRTENQMSVTCSSQRQAKVAEFPEPKTAREIENILSDQSNSDFPIFIGEGMTTKLAHIKTVAVGIFNISERTWTLYTGRPSKSDPVVAINMKFL